MKKLNELRESYRITAYGFKAFTDYAAESNPDGPEVVVSTLSPSAMIDMCVEDYYAPVMPRGARYTTASDIVDADLDVNHVTVSIIHDMIDTHSILIVSRHPGTIKMLRSLYPTAQVITGDVSAEDIRDSVVVGTLPPHLAAECSAYIAVTIDNFDRCRDGDLDGDELQHRVRIRRPVKVTID